MIWLVGHQGMMGQEIAALLRATDQPYLGSGREVDIGNPQQVFAFCQSHPEITWIVNCAAMTAVDRCESEQAVAQASNTLGPGHLAQAAGHLGAGLCHLSTDYVFDGQQTRPYTEQDPTCPTSIYGTSKLAGEQAIAEKMTSLWQQDARGRNGQLARAMIVRTSWLYGKGSRHFVGTMLRLMAERQQLAVVDDQQGSPTWGADLARALLQVLQEPQILQHPYEIVHFSNQGTTTWFGFAESILQLARQWNLPLVCQSIKAIDSSAYPTPAQRPAYSVLCTKKISQWLGRSPRSWQTALRAYFQVCYGSSARHQGAVERKEGLGCAGW